jgi:hypothetical protein
MQVVGGSSASTNTNTTAPGSAPKRKPRKETYI